MSIETRTASQRAILVAVQLPAVADEEFESSLKELQELARTLGFEVVATFTQKRASFDATAYIGAGKLEALREFALDNADFVLVDHDISPSQAGNLEKAVGCQVMDRAMVILEIFHRHARSRAAQAQVEIARLRYLAPRLREAAKLAGPQGRQRSGVGGRGAGESAAQTDRSRIRDRIAELKHEIVALDHERQTQRARRQDSQGVARVALVGYTNAGKSTLMRALTGSDVLVENKLFATLDTTVRVLVPEGVPRVLVSDTVGFIKNLPHDLVASFKSTLEEAAEASLLLHVVDAGDPGFERQLDVTVQVLEEIDAGAVPRLLVFNKIDQVGDAKAQAARGKVLRARFPKCIIVSALVADDVARLHKAILAFFRKRLVKAELFLPWSAQKLRGPLFASCEVVEERPDAEGTFFTVRGERKDIDALREQIGPVKKPPARAPAAPGQA
jgi:GTP-binding protein HflX